MGEPESKVGPSARVVVNVIRNMQIPRFLGEPYRKNLTQGVKVGSDVLQVRAEDRDNKVGGHLLFKKLIKLFEICNIDIEIDVLLCALM